MKTFGNIILMTVICIVIFWVFMALRPASAQPAGFFGPGPAGDGFPHPPPPPVISRQAACINAAMKRTRGNLPSVQNAAVRSCVGR